MMAFLRGLSQRVGRRPLAWFLMLWGIATLLWLGSGVIHFRLARAVDRPPVPEGVLYADFLPGGAQHSPALTILIDVDSLPTYDLRAAQSEHRFIQWPGGATATPSRAVCLVTTSDGAYGWPRQWVRWSRYSAYDVTDPGRPFKPALLPRDAIRVTWQPLQLSWVLPVDDRTAYWQGAWQWARMLAWAVGVELAAAFLVLALWTWDGVLLRRRARMGLCLACGYDRRGSSETESCPECGIAPEAVPDRITWIGRVWQQPGRLFLAAWGVLAFVWLAGSLITSSSRVEESHQERMDWMIQEAARLGPNPGGVAHTFRHIVAGREYGWPIRVVETLRLQFFKCQPGGTPSPAPHGIPTYTWAGRGQFSRTTVPTDPSVLASFSLVWTNALASLAGLQFIALAIVGVVCADRRVRRTART